MIRAHITSTGTITKPMLAARSDGEDLNALTYPLGVTNKIDGIRCLKIDGHAVSRTFKPIPNKYIRGCIEQHLPDGMDMEIVAGPTFQESTGNIMREDGTPEFWVWVIDYVPQTLDEPYRDRILKALQWAQGFNHGAQKPYGMRVGVLMPETASSLDEVTALESKALAEGHEGVMLRKLDAPYKCGRSTFREGILIKLKRFIDAEAVVRGVEELYHNENEAKVDAFGRTKRATTQEHLKAGATLGSLVVEGCGGDYHGVSFKIGTGFTKSQRHQLWDQRTEIVGKIVKFTYFPTGIKDAPRFPAFIGFRDARDFEA
jgi:DNA ligase 1